MACFTERQKERNVIRNRSCGITSAKIPWSKSGEAFWSGGVVPVVHSSLSSGLIPTHCSLASGFGWGNASETCRHKAGYVCASPCDVGKEEARCLVTYPHPPHPSTEHQAILAPCLPPWSCAVAFSSKDYQKQNKTRMLMCYRQVLCHIVLLLP